MKVGRALPRAERFARACEDHFGDSDMRSVIARLVVAFAYHGLGNVEKACGMYESILQIAEERLSPDSFLLEGMRENLAVTYLTLNRHPDQAAQLLETCVATNRRVLGELHPRTIQSRQNLAGAYFKFRQFSNAGEQLERAWTAESETLGADDPVTIVTRTYLAVTYHRAGNLPQALAHFESVAAAVEAQQFRHKDADVILGQVVRAYEAAGKVDRAEAWQRKWLAVVKERSGFESVGYADELMALTQFLIRCGKWADAEAAGRECLAVRERIRPNAWNTFYTKSLIGEARAQQKDFREAKALLLAGYQGMKDREASIPLDSARHIPETIDRLIALYTATNLPDDAAKWRAERAKYPAINTAPPLTGR
jgi:tetratricopeptide (TPR) repeat protein